MIGQQASNGTHDLIRTVALAVVILVSLLSFTQIALALIYGKTRRQVSVMREDVGSKLGAISKAVNHVEPGQPPLIERVIQQGERMATVEARITAVDNALSTMHRSLETVDVRVKSVGDHIYETEHNARSSLEKVERFGARVEQFGAKVEQAISRLGSVEKNLSGVTDTAKKVERWLEGHATGQILEREDDPPKEGA